jgi:hypothetical protein
MVPHGEVGIIVASLGQQEALAGSGVLQRSFFGLPGNAGHAFLFQ